MKYTARDGGSGLKNLANASLKDQLNVITQRLSQDGLHIAINMKHDLSSEWFLLKKSNTLNLTLDKSRLPYMAQTIDAVIENVVFIAKPQDPAGAAFSVTVDGVPVPKLSLIEGTGIYRGTSSAIQLDTAFTLALSTKAELDNLDELMMVLKYSF